MHTNEADSLQEAKPKKPQINQDLERKCKQHIFHSNFP